MYGVVRVRLLEVDDRLPARGASLEARLRHRPRAVAGPAAGVRGQEAEAAGSHGRDTSFGLPCVHHCLAVEEDGLRGHLGLSCGLGSGSQCPSNAHHLHARRSVRLHSDLLVLLLEESCRTVRRLLVVERHLVAVLLLGVGVLPGLPRGREDALVALQEGLAVVKDVLAVPDDILA
eukprot:11495247-Alexandrium_andersonii.AAC.1